MTDSTRPDGPDERTSAAEPAAPEQDPIASFLAEMAQGNGEESSSDTPSDHDASRDVHQSSPPEASSAGARDSSESTDSSDGAGSRADSSSVFGSDGPGRGLFLPDPMMPESAILAPIPGSGERRPGRFLVGAGVLTVVAIVLVWLGIQILLGSNDGRLVTKIEDRAAPGFEAIVEKTPTGLVLMVGDDGSLSSATVIALTSEDLGGVLSIPIETEVYVPLSSGVVAPIALDALVRESGVELAIDSLGGLLNLEFTDVHVLRPADLTARIGTPLVVSNPSEVLGTDGTVLFPKGSITLNAEDVWPFISSSSPAEEPVARAARHEAFWRAWLASGRTAADQRTADDGDLGSYLTVLASEQVTYQTLPVVEIDAAGGVPARVRLSPDVTGPEAIAPIVPLPEGAPGRRPRLRVVDGTGQLDDAQGAAIILAAGGGQVDVIGNARLFGFLKTQIVYYDPQQRAAAELMRDVLGVGEIVQSTQTNSALDLTITIGSDYLDRVGPSVSGAEGD